jgi:phosphoheptose isomerase
VDLLVRAWQHRRRVLNIGSAWSTCDLRRLVEELGQEFRRRRMDKHAQLLRAFYRAIPAAAYAWCVVD